MEQGKGWDSRFHPVSQEPAHGEGAMGRTGMQSVSLQQPGAVLEPVPLQNSPLLGDHRSGTPGTGHFRQVLALPHSPGGDDARRCQHP